MDNRKKQRNKRITIVVIVVLVVTSAISLIVGRSSTGIEKMLRDSIAVVEYYVVKKPIEFVSGIFGEFASLKDVYEENAILKKQLENYTNIVAKNDILEQEIDKLKEVTEIGNIPSDYKMKLTYVSSRPVESWNSEITIGLGSFGGVEENMVVITSKGMVGIVTSVTEVSATVSLLTSEKFVNQLPVKILNGDQTVYGLLDKFNVDTGTYEVTLLTDVEKLEKDAKMYTSGLGGDGKSPEGILVGTASEIKVMADGTTTKLYALPAADFSDLGYLAVIQKGTKDE